MWVCLCADVFLISQTILHRKWRHVFRCAVHSLLGRDWNVIHSVIAVSTNSVHRPHMGGTCTHTHIRTEKLTHTSHSDRKTVRHIDSHTPTETDSLRHTHTGTEWHKQTSSSGQTWTDKDSQSHSHHLYFLKIETNSAASRKTNYNIRLLKNFILRKLLDITIYSITDKI